MLAFAGAHGWPVIVKTSRGGYDGKGVWKVEGPEDPALADAVATGAAAGVALLAEEFVAFERELSALAVRSPSGQAVAYPVVQSTQRDGVCFEVIAPAPDLDEDLAVQAQRIALTVARDLGVTGVLAVELFQVRRPDGTAGLLVNELAMRPHNTGHWSIEGAVTSQFENHVRAVLDLPLGSPRQRQPWTVMVNLLGSDLPETPLGLPARLRPRPAPQGPPVRQGGQARAQDRPCHRLRLRPRRGRRPRPARRVLPRGRDR